MTVSLQGPGRQNSPEPWADLLARLEATRRELSDVTSSLLRSAGISVSPEGMSVESALRVLGDLNVSGDAQFSGDTEIGGNARITGTLSLPAGIIDNEALANPVTFDADWGAGESYATPMGAWLEVASASITIPAGFTKMQFTAAGMANGLNSTAATANMYVQIHRTVNGGGGYTSQQGQVALPAGFQGVASSFYLWNEAVVPGEVHRFALRVWTSGAFAASAYNYARVDVAALFGR